jgi:DNA-binding transcriptional MerR regulator
MIYSIADLEQLSGISTHTIRKWEQRYRALNPLRSSGNTRLYDDEELKRLLNLVTLTQMGLSISKACKLNEPEIDAYLAKGLGKSAGASTFEYYISQLVAAGLNYREYEIHELFNECIAAFGVKTAYAQVMYPLLVRLGMMWQRDQICPAHEHFLSAIIRQKIIAATERLPRAKQEGPCWLLFLPEDEDHEIGLLLANYLLRFHRQRVVYLGAKTPLVNVEAMQAGLEVSHFLFFMVKPRRAADAVKYLGELLAIAGNRPVCLAGNQKLIGGLSPGKTFTWLQSLSDLEGKIDEKLNLDSRP